MRQNFVVPALLLALAGCSGEGQPEGQYHRPLCNIPFINEDFLTGGMNDDWRERSPGAGSFLVESEGSGPSKRGWLSLTSDRGDVSEADRSAYGLRHVAPSEDYRLRLQLTDAPTGAGRFAGLLVEVDRDNLVAFGLRGDGSAVRPELLGVSEAATVFASAGDPVDPASVLLVLIRFQDEFIARIGDAEVGRGELALSRDGTDAAVVAGSADGSPTTITVEWVEGCPYFFYDDE